MNSNMKIYNVIDLFAGVGGLSYGFAALLQFNIVAANEIEKDIAAAYRLNHPEVEMMNCDVSAMTEETLQKATKGRRVDVIVGGPPCQSYSTLGKRQMDARANLFTQYERILAILQPRAFVFENVTGILSMDKGRLFERVKAAFAALGYDLSYKVLNAVDYGVPQYRERVFLVGFKGKNDFVFPAPTHGEGLKPYVTLKDAFCDLPPLKSGESSDRYAGGISNEFLAFVRSAEREAGGPSPAAGAAANDNAANSAGAAAPAPALTEHRAPKNGAHLLRIMETLQEGQSKDDLPEDIRPKSGYGNTYAKLWWDKPAATITRNFACPSSSRCIHPRDSRAMSIREGARLQSFPDHYEFYGSDGMKRLEIGNAVPPLLSMAIARQMLAALERE